MFIAVLTELEKTVDDFTFLSKEEIAKLLPKNAAEESNILPNVLKLLFEEYLLDKISRYI